jgi:hypothetical protein
LQGSTIRTHSQLPFSTILGTIHPTADISNCYSPIPVANWPITLAGGRKPAVNWLISDNHSPISLLKKPGAEEMLT